MSAIHKAIESGDSSAVQELIERDPGQVKDRSTLGNTPLHLAIKRGQLSIAKLLLEAGADVNAPDQEGNTPLHLVAMEDQPELIDALIAHGAKLDVENRAGWTPLQWAATASPEVADELLAHGASCDLYSAVRLTDIDHIRQLLSDPRSIGSVRKPESLLEAGVLVRSPEILRLLLDHGVPVNPADKRYGPLFAAIEQALPERDFTLVRFLLEHGADPNVQDDSGRSLLSFVERYGTTTDDLKAKKEALDLLTRYGAVE